MEHKIIPTDQYLLVVDDEVPTKIGQYYVIIDIDGNVHGIGKVEVFPYMQGIMDKLILAHLPLNNAPKLEGVDFLPGLPTQSNVLREAIANKLFGWIIQNKSDGLSSNVMADEILSIVESSKKWYSEEAMREAIYVTMITMNGKPIPEDAEGKIIADNIIKSISKPVIPVGFRRKTITNKEDKVVPVVSKNGDVIKWQGEYIYKTE